MNRTMTGICVFIENGVSLPEMKRLFSSAQSGRQLFLLQEKRARNVYQKEALMQKNYTLVSAIVFGAVALFHLVRAFTGWEVSIGSHMIPVVRSWIAFGITICLAAWAIRGSKGYAIVSAVVFGLVALLHLYRAAITGTVVTIDNLLVPVAASWVGFLVSAALATWGVGYYRFLKS